MIVNQRHTSASHLKPLDVRRGRVRAFILEWSRRLRNPERRQRLRSGTGGNFGGDWLITDDRTGKWLGDELNKRGIKIKVFKPVPGQDYTSYFRITLGVKNENAYLCEQLDDLLG